MEVEEDRYSTIGFLPGICGIGVFLALRRTEMIIYEDYSKGKLGELVAQQQVFPFSLNIAFSRI